MIIHIMGMVVQMSGTGQSPMRGMVTRIKLVRLESKKLMMMRIWKLVPTIISKLQALVLAHQLLLKTPIFPILSVLLVGSCHTVARVGIIIINLDLGDIYLQDMTYRLMMAQLRMLPKLNHIHFPTSTLAATTGVRVACTTRVTMATTGPLP